MMTRICAGFLLFLFTALTAPAQWLPATSGTTKSMRGVYLLNSGVAYAVGDGGTILKSTDTGASWTALVSGTTKNLYDLYFFDDNNGVAVGDSGVILRTTDGGATWSGVVSGVRDGLRAVSFNGANGICGGLSQDILYSSDSGATWHVSQKGFFGGGFFGAQMLSASTGFVTGQNSIFQAMAGMTMNGGADWSFHPFYFNGNEGSCDDLFFFDETTGVSSGVLFDGEGAIARTTNGGVDWTSTLFSNGLQGIDFPSPDSGFVVGYVGTIFHSTDMGVTWSPQASGTGLDLYDVHFQSNALDGLAVGAAGIILRTTNGGEEGSGLALIAAVSRKNHFDINLPLTGTPGIECRAGGARGYYQLLFTFNNGLSSVDQVTTSCGVVDRAGIDPTDSHEFRVGLDGVNCSAEVIAVTLSGVHDEQGNTLANVTLSFGLLVGDVDANGVVDSADFYQVVSNRGQDTNANNFHNDINNNGSIGKMDLSIVQSQLGMMLPP